MKINKYLVAVGLAVGLTVGFAGCGGGSDSNDKTDSDGSVGELSTISGSSLAAANSTTANALETLFRDEPDTVLEDVIDDLLSMAVAEDSYSFENPLSVTYDCETSGTITFSGTYSDYEISSLTVTADECVGGSYYFSSIDGGASYTMSDTKQTYSVDSDLTFDTGYYGDAGTLSKGSSIEYTRNGDSIHAVVNVEYTDSADNFYRQENFVYNVTLDEYDDMTAIDLVSGTFYVSDTTYVEYASDTLSGTSGYPDGDVVFNAANDGVITVTYSYGYPSATVTTESTVDETTDNTDDTTSGTATSLSDAVTVNGTLTTATDKMTYEATDFTGVSFTCGYVYIRVEDANGSTDNPDTGLTADVNVTIYKDGVESITLDPSPGYAVGSLKAIDSSYNVISKITVEVEPKDNSADNVGTFTIKYSNPCN